MTLVLTVTGPESIWMLADRRVSYKDRPPKDAANKIMTLETTDGRALLGYAGLGETALGTEPAEWMSGVLRGRNLLLEQSLAALADAMKRELPTHLATLSVAEWQPHTVLVPAFLGAMPRLYSIDIALSPDRTQYAFRQTRWVVKGPTRTQRVAVTGSGAPYMKRHEKKWMRELLRLVGLNDRDKVSGTVVAEYLAHLNIEVHSNVTDQSVGPRCTVTWRYRMGGFHNGGGAHECYTGVARDRASPPLPTIVNGGDLRALISAMTPIFLKQHEEKRAGKPGDLDEAGLKAKLAELPDTPDETLR